MDHKVNRALTWLLAIFLCLNSHAGLALLDKGVFSPVNDPANRLVFFYGEPFNVSDSLADSLAPALAVSGNTVHVVWEEGGRIYHRFCQKDTWSLIRSVATGEQPDIAIDVSGMAHIVFVNEFGGNYEIYHCRWNGTVWSLPRNVSNTSGVSSAPCIAIAPNGTLHVVWADNTPGYNVIYHAYWNGVYWLNEPIPNAQGGAPTISVGNDEIVHVVWQDRDTPTAPYEVYHSQWNSMSWSLPENLSDSAMAQSIIPSMAVDQDNETHVMWQEKVGVRYIIYYTWGRLGFWSVPEGISGGDADAYLPSVAVTLGGTIYAGWDENTVALYRQKGKAYSLWSQPTAICSDTQGVASLQLAIDNSGQLHAAWLRRITANNWDVFYQRLSVNLFMPVILK